MQVSKDIRKSKFNYALLYRRTCLIVYDIISVIAASFLAILIRYEFAVDAIPAEFMLPIRNSLIINIVLTLGIFYAFRLYHSLWAFAGETEMQNLTVACFLASVVTALLLFLFKVGGQPVPSSYYFMYFFLLLMCIFGSRFSYRF